ncbi:MAG: type II secretion system ATPase GspE [Mariprofundales bacterium]
MKQLTRIGADLIDADRLLPFSLAVLRQGPILPLKPSDDGSNPVVVPNDGDWPWELLDDCRRLFGSEVTPLLASRDTILTALNQTFDMASASAEQMMEDLDEHGALSKEFEEISDLLDAEDEAPVIRLINTLISQALKERGSDIHIEPFETKVQVRFRIDGILHTIITPPKSVQAAMSSRIKVMAGLDIAEKRHPQDGRFRVRIAAREVDVRVSILPTAQGERIVLRLLDKSAGVMSLTSLGMSEPQLQTIQQATTAPHGLLLVTGPTGSGKSTTLYASLMQVDRANRNVMTIEDPIEYQLEGVGQMQVQQKIGLSFASGLRSILRQDPDIVMIGEIRDLETAEIAIQASLTGHLVFATLHTNDSLSAIVRLQDMGVEPYLVASSLTLVQAQRLVRRLCSHCRKPKPVGDNDWKVLDMQPADFAGVDTIYEAAGCEECMQTGYKGRVAIYEMALISDAMRNLIHEGKNLQAARKQAKCEGMLTLRQDGARHIALGVTTVDEVLRVTLEDVVVA